MGKSQKAPSPLLLACGSLWACISQPSELGPAIYTFVEVLFLCFVSVVLFISVVLYFGHFYKPLWIPLGRKGKQNKWLYNTIAIGYFRKQAFTLYWKPPPSQSCCLLLLNSEMIPLLGYAVLCLPLADWDGAGEKRHIQASNFQFLVKTKWPLDESKSMCLWECVCVCVILTFCFRCRNVWGKRRLCRFCHLELHPYNFPPHWLSSPFPNTSFLWCLQLLIFLSLFYYSLLSTVNLLFTVTLYPSFELRG